MAGGREGLLRGTFVGDFVDDMLARYGYPDDEMPEPEDEVVCKFCDTPYLRWEEARGEHNRKTWVLVDMGGRIHDCRKRISLDDFPKVNT